MTAKHETGSPARTPLSRERVLHAAVALADAEGLPSLSMRRLGQELGVEAMSLYNHVASKDDVLDGVVDLVMQEIEVEPSDGAGWQASVRRSVLAAREVLTRHSWMPAVIETRTTPTPAMMAYMDAMIGRFLAGGFSVDLTHHALHVLGSRVLGFTQELYDDDGPASGSAEDAMLLFQQMASQYPNMARMFQEVLHDTDDAILGDGCDSDAEFVFGLDLILDGLERLRTAS
ncbi:MAG: TetR/AcrR family transcriptional regulator [Dehalococcoidia bacterium]